VYAGEISSVLPTAFGSGAKASFGAVSGVVVDVTHGLSAPVAAVVQPAGSAGAVTPSKFSPQPVTGVPVAVAVGVFVGVPVGPPEILPITPFEKSAPLPTVGSVVNTKFAPNCVLVKNSFPLFPGGVPIALAPTVVELNERPEPLSIGVTFM